MTALVSHGPAFGTPEYREYVESQFAAPAVSRAARLVRPRAVQRVALAIALLPGFGIAAQLTGAVDVLSLVTPAAKVTVVPADDEVDEPAGGTVLIEVDAR